MVALWGGVHCVPVFCTVRYHVLMSEVSEEMIKLGHVGRLGAPCITQTTLSPHTSRNDAQIL